MGLLSGISIACEEYGSKFFANGAAPSGVLEHLGTIKDPSRVGQRLLEEATMLIKWQCLKKA